MMISKVNSLNFGQAQDTQLSASKGSGQHILDNIKNFEDVYVASDDKSKAKVSTALVGFSALTTTASLFLGKHKVLKGLFGALSLLSGAALIKLNVSVINNKKETGANEANAVIEMPAQNAAIESAAPTQEQAAQESAIADVEKVIAANENAATQQAAQETPEAQEAPKADENIAAQPTVEEAPAAADAQLALPGQLVSTTQG